MERKAVTLSYTHESCNVALTLHQVLLRDPQNNYTVLKQNSGYLFKNEFTLNFDEYIIDVNNIWINLP